MLQILFGAGSAAAFASYQARLASSSCGAAHGSLRVSVDGVRGSLKCFSPEVEGAWASITGTGLVGGNRAGIQMNFLSRARTQTCKIPMVVIELMLYHNKKEIMWTAYRVRNWDFGRCVITQNLKNNHKVWRGTAHATLVVVGGNTSSGSPRWLDTLKGNSGKPLTRHLVLNWQFDRISKQSKGSPKSSQ